MNAALVFLIGLAVTLAIGFGTYVAALRRADPGTFTASPFIRGGFLPAAWIVGFIVVAKTGILDVIEKQAGSLFH